MKKFLPACVCALVVAGTALAQTQAKTAPKPAGIGKTEADSNEEKNIRAYIELLRTDVRKSKSLIMAEVMQFDAGDAAKFWPIYKEFEAEYATLGDQIVELVREYTDHYDSLTDEVADKLASQILNIEQQRNTLKRKYYLRTKEALGALTAARFLQVENQLERLVNLQVSAQLPVVGGR